MRSTVQLLIDCSNQLLDIRLETLRVLLMYCDPRAVDAETRYAAVDGVGTIILTLANVSEAEFAADSSYESLFELCEVSVQMLLQNLRNSVNILSRHGGEGMDGIPSKLLVSILRALSQPLATFASNMTKVSFRFTALFQPHFQSLIQILHVLFERVLPPIDKRTPKVLRDFSTSKFALSSNLKSLSRQDSLSRGRGRSSNTEPAGSSVSTSVSATSPVTKMWVGSLKLLGALAAFNPGAFVGSWQLFLSNSLAVDLETTAAVNRLVASCNDVEFSRMNRNYHRGETFSSLVKSPIYSALLLAVNSSVRAEAARALRLMIRIEAKYLRKWIRLQAHSSELLLEEANGRKLDIHEKVHLNSRSLLYCNHNSVGFFIENEYDSKDDADDRDISLSREGRLCTHGTCICICGQLHTTLALNPLFHTYRRCFKCLNI